GGASLGGRGVGRRWQIGAVVVSVAVVASAAVIGVATKAAVWGFPLADLVWAFDVLNLIQLTAAEVLAVALGTPGCEIGAWSELLARAGRGTARSEDVLACIVGLHLVDAWEESAAQRSGFRDMTREAPCQMARPQARIPQIDAPIWDRRRIERRT